MANTNNKLYRILHLVNGEHYAGAERVQDLLAEKLGDLNFQVGFVCLKRGIFENSRRYQQAPLISFPMRFNLDVTVAPRVLNYVRQNDYDLIHTHTVRASLIGSIVSVNTKLPMVHHVHSPSTRDTESLLRNFRNSLTEDMCIKRAARLIAVSASLEEYLIENGKRGDRIRVVPNGVPIEPDVETPGFDGGKLILGTVALFRPRKGIEILLEAISRQRSLGFDVVLHAVGPFETEEYKNSIDRLVRDLRLEDAITWTGFTKDVIAEFSNMHVFVLPSLYGEGMPMVVLEAMSMGLPVISTTVEGIPEVVRDGIEGLLIKPDDTEAMVSTIGNIIQGKIDLAAMGQASKRRQRNHFSDRSMAEGVAAVYRELLS